MSATAPPRTWAEIDLDALRHNLAVAREQSGCRIMAVVKAGAYGHGLEAVARTLEAEDVAFLGVAHVGEARRIRAAGVASRIYLLGATWEAERAEIVARDWTPCLSSLEEARHFSALAQARGTRLRCHLAVDTGMGRGGFVPDALPAVLPQLEALPGIEIEGIGSHLPSADEDADFTRDQFQVFRQLVECLGGRRRFKWIHLSNSAGLLGYDNAPCNLVRPGLMLYGLAPLAAHQSRLRPAMSLRSRVTLVRQLPAGHGVSYGREFITRRPTTVATIGVGYGDGYPRSLSGQGAEVVVRGRRLPVIGRVTMDQIMVDATGADLAVGDEVELFGAQLPIDELARRAGTIAWELLTRITPRVERLHRPA